MTEQRSTTLMPPSQRYVNELQCSCFILPGKCRLEENSLEKLHRPTGAYYLCVCPFGDSKMKSTLDREGHAFVESLLSGCV